MSSFTRATFDDTGRRREGRRIWKVDGGFRFYIGYVGSTLYVDVPAGFETDGPSAPTWLLRLFPKSWIARMVKSSCVHDLLREDLRYCLIDTDAAFLVAMKAEETPALLREAAFIAVRLNRSRTAHNQ